MQHRWRSYLGGLCGESWVPFWREDSSEGFHSAELMEISDFSRLRLNFMTKMRLFRGVWGMLPQKILKIMIFRLAKIEFQTKTFHDFLMTFGLLKQFPLRQFL